MDKLKLTGQNLGRVFKSRLGRVCIGHELYTFCKTAELKVENSAQTTFGLSSELPDPGIARLVLTDTI